MASPSSVINPNPESPSPETASALVLTGMHQSGLGIAASVLKEAGVRIVEAPEQENLSFINFHASILEGSLLSLQPAFTLRTAHIAQAEKLICHYAQENPWGWVDPNTTLFLEFWNTKLPNSNFIFIYDSPESVVERLYEHLPEKFRVRPELALESWIDYNEKILAFVQQFPQQCLVLPLSHVIQSPSEFINIVNQKFTYQLTIPNCQPIATGITSVPRQVALIRATYPEALEMYTQLQKITNSKLSFSSNLSAHHFDSSHSSLNWSFQDWLHLKAVQVQQKKLKIKLTVLENELDLKLTQLHKTQEELVDCQLELRQQAIALEKHEKQNTVISTKTYQDLVRQAWSAYCQTNHFEMANLLQQSTTHTDLSKTAMILDWLSQFSKFSQTTQQPFNEQELTRSTEWNQLVTKTMMPFL